MFSVQRLLGALVRPVDHALHFGVDELRRLLGHLAAVLDLAAEEELLLVVANEDRADRVRESPLRHVPPRDRLSPSECRSPRRS